MRHEKCSSPWLFKELFLFFFFVCLGTCKNGCWWKTGGFIAIIPPTVLLFPFIAGLWRKLFHGLFLEMGFQKFQLLIYGGAGQNCVASVQPFCEPSLIRFLIALVLLNEGQWESLCKYELVYTFRLNILSLLCFFSFHNSYHFRQNKRENAKTKQKSFTTNPFFPIRRPMKQKIVLEPTILDHNSST